MEPACAPYVQGADLHLCADASYSQDDSGPWRRGVLLGWAHTRQPCLLLGAERHGPSGAFSGCRTDELGKQSSHAGAELDGDHAENTLTPGQSRRARESEPWELRVRGI